MKRLMIGLVAAGIVLAAGVSSAQESRPEMPETVRAFLDAFVGTWTYDGSFKGRVTIEWDAGRGCLIATGQEEFGGGIAHWTELMHWDGTSDDGVAIFSHFTSGEAIACSDIHGKILSRTVMEGEKTAVRFGQKDTARIRIKFNGKHEFVSEVTNVMVGGKKQSDETFVFSRVKPTTRKDFDEFCELFKGRWVCEMRLLEDAPGLGSQGDTFTAYFHSTLSESGNYITSEAHYGDHWQSQLKYYDPVAKAIKTTVADSTGATWFATDRKVPGGWRTCIIEIGVDGTKEGEWILNHTFSKDGKTWSVKVTTAADESTILATNVWRRMSK